MIRILAPAKRDAAVQRPFGRIQGVVGALHCSVPMPLVMAVSVSLSPFGQNATVEFPGKIHSIRQLKAADKKEQRQLLNAQVRMKSVLGKLRPNRYFSTQKDSSGRWWLLAPDGSKFISTGLDCIDTMGGAYQSNLIKKWGTAKYKTLARQRAIDRMKYWGFNSFGNWPDQYITRSSKIPYVHMGPETWNCKVEYLDGDICDVFDPAFPSEAVRCAASLSKLKSDQYLIGYFIDNELHWWNIGYDVLSLSSQKSHAKRAWLQQLDKKYGTVEKLNAAWKTNAGSFEDLRWPGDGKNAEADADLAVFRAEFAERFYDGWYRAVRAADPNHLVLGSRIPYPMDDVVQACARHTDVLSFNHYAFELWPKLDQYAKLGKPILIGEYGFDSLDAGLLGAAIKVKSQKDRGIGFQYLTEQLAAKPYIVGAHYFQYIDEPLFGRSDGENSYNGFVNIADIPYPELVSAARRTNPRLVDIHAGRIKPTNHKPNQ